MSLPEIGWTYRENGSRQACAEIEGRAEDLPRAEGKPRVEGARSRVRLSKRRQRIENFTEDLKGTKHALRGDDLMI